jgi:hypothetical protein
MLWHDHCREREREREREVIKQLRVFTLFSRGKYQDKNPLLQTKDIPFSIQEAGRLYFMPLLYIT